MRREQTLKLHQTEGRISSNLLKRKQFSRKTSFVCRRLKDHDTQTEHTKNLNIKT